MKVPTYFWMVFVPIVLGALVFLAKGPQARFVPVIKPSVFQGPSDLGYWTYKQIRPRLIQVQKLRVFYSEDQKEFMTEFVGSFTAENRKDNLGQLTLEVEALPLGARLEELSSANTLVFLIGAYGAFDENIVCDEGVGRLGWNGELRCMLKANARKFHQGKVTGNGKVSASVDLVGERVYAVTSFLRP